MTTRAKLYITSYTTSAMMLLNVFSKPLHIPEPFQWVLMVGIFIPLGFMFYLIKKQKQEKQAQPAATDATAPPASATRQTVRKRLILMMLLGSVIGLCSPLWLPLTGTTLGPKGDFICGIITVAIVCSIFGFRLRKL
jgi:hypothetical protein